MCVLADAEASTIMVFVCSMESKIIRREKYKWNIEKMPTAINLHHTTLSVSCSHFCTITHQEEVYRINTYSLTHTHKQFSYCGIMQEMAMYNSKASTHTQNLQFDRRFIQVHGSIFQKYIDVFIHWMLKWCTAHKEESESETE